MTASELVENAGVPDRFRQIMILYLETYEARVSDVYRTLRHKVIALAHFWRFIRDEHPDVKRCSQILPRHIRDYIPHAIRRAREVQRGPGAGDEVRPTAHSWLVDLRVFFSDLCAWATEPDSPFKRFAPRTIPATRHTFSGTVSTRHANAPELASQRRYLISNARCRRFAPSLFSSGKLL